MQQLAAYNQAFGKFFDRLAKDGITRQNTLFTVTADEDDQFVGGKPSPVSCDGIHVPCTYAQRGEIDGDLSRLLATQRGNTTPFLVHSDSAPTFYVTSNPGRTDPVTRQLERDVALLTAVNPITGVSEPLSAALADHVEQDILHMITKGPNRTPTFIMFADDHYFLSASGKTTGCDQAPACISEETGLAWNRGNLQEQITKTFLGVVGPGVRHEGRTTKLFSDHTDIRPTLATLVGLKDDYRHDGRVLVEVLDDDAVPWSLNVHGDTLVRLAEAYKDINAPRGDLGRETLHVSTHALRGNDATYNLLEGHLTQILHWRNDLAEDMIGLLEDAAFNDKPIDEHQARRFIDAADDLLERVQ